MHHNHGLCTGDGETYSFSVVVGEITENTTIRNIATVSTDGLPDVETNPCDVLAVPSAPNLTLTKTSSIPEGTKVREGDEITYTIVVRNDGDGIARNVVIHDIVPKNTTYYDKETGIKDSEKTIVDSEPKDILQPGETYTYEFTVVVNPIEEDTIIKNAATVTADNDEGGTSNTVEIPATTSDPILRVEKTSSIPTGSSVKEGDLITYTITVYNDGYGPANNIIIRDTVPTGTTYYDNATNTTNPEITSVNSETKATLNPGESFSFSFTVKVGRISVATVIENTAKVIGDNVPETPTNPVKINADPTVPNLRVVKTSSIAEGSSVKEGDIITYTITVYNDGNTPAYNVTINDTVPENTTYYENNTRHPDKVNIGYPIPVLNPGESKSLSFSVIVEEILADTVIKNTSTVTAENSPNIPSNELEIIAKTTTPSLTLEKVSSIAEGATVKPGDIITYTITIKNTGNSIAHNVVISDVIPEHTIYVEKTGSKYVRNNSKTTVEKTIETLNPGESESLTFSVVVDTLTSNVQITNTAKATANNSPQISSNTVKISAKPKENTSSTELPYTGRYSLIIIGIIAIICTGVFAVYEYKRIKK